jgi:Ca-activated chloride channel family protein
MIPSQLDESALRVLSTASGGRFFRASDGDALRGVFREIDGLEHSRLAEVRYGAWADTTRIWLLVATVLLAFEAALSATLLRRLS